MEGICGCREILVKGCPHLSKISLGAGFVRQLLSVKSKSEYGRQKFSPDQT